MVNAFAERRNSKKIIKRERKLIQYKNLDYFLSKKLPYIKSLHKSTKLLRYQHAVYYCDHSKNIHIAFTLGELTVVL